MYLEHITSLSKFFIGWTVEHNGRGVIYSCYGLLHMQLRIWHIARCTGSDSQHCHQSNIGQSWIQQCVVLNCRSHDNRKNSKKTDLCCKHSDNIWKDCAPFCTFAVFCVLHCITCMGQGMQHMISQEVTKITKLLVIGWYCNNIWLHNIWITQSYLIWSIIHTIMMSKSECVWINELCNNKILWLWILRRKTATLDDWSKKLEENKCLNKYITICRSPVWKLKVIPLRILIALQCRNRRLFSHVFRSHRCLWSTVLLNFR